MTSVYIPKQAYNNNTASYIQKYVQSIGQVVLIGNNKNAIKQRLWEQADFIIPPTQVELATLIERVTEIDESLLTKKVTQALSIASEKHKMQIRKSGVPYFTGHITPTLLYLILVQKKTKDILNEDMVLTTICHDLVEDTDIKINDLTLLFGENVSKNVDILTKKKTGVLTQSEKIILNTEYVGAILNANYQVQVIKCVDRILNITDDIQNLVTHKNSTHVIKYMEESIHFYKPLFVNIAKTNSYYLTVFDLLYETLNSISNQII